ncbi:MAG: flotillin-like protein FloA [Firmicutes bacterium]|nr:flotillin-like protein FloA [Bacillota bacterium]
MMNVISMLLADGDRFPWEWIVALCVVVVAAAVFFGMVPTKLWFRSLVSGAHISMIRLLGMKLRKIKVEMIVNAYISSKKAGIRIPVDELETHYMAGGDVIKVVDALIAAHSAKISLTTQDAKAIDLAGRDVLDAVRSSVNPRIIETPVVSAITKDGIELRVKARVTVKANIAKLVGGAGQDTIVARVGEGIITTLGSSSTHKEILRDPNLISKVVLEKGLDEGTAFEILSIDIADIDIGRNVGAQLLIDQAEADMHIAQAKAEERRAMAIAYEHEMRARTQEMKAQVVAAEAAVPKAMADAFIKGNLGIMDYYKMQNVQADTTMRSSFAGGNKNRLLADNIDGDSRGNK